jgi:hypothetical protein
MRFSSIRPFSFFLTPPHCLKKKGVFVLIQTSRMEVTHSLREFSDIIPPNQISSFADYCISWFLSRTFYQVHACYRKQGGTMAHSFGNFLQVQNPAFAAVYSLNRLKPELIDL